MTYTIEQQEKGAEFIRTLVQKSWENAVFKDELVRNPVAAIEQVTGKNLPFLSGKKIVVVDQTDESAIYINIPAQPKIDELELTEEQLEMIAGGLTPALGAYAVGCAVGIGVCWLVSQL